MTQDTSPTPGREDISDRHARGLCRDLFRAQTARVGRPLPLLLRRIRTVRQLYPSAREAGRVYLRTRQSFLACSDYISEVRTEEEGRRTAAVLLLPASRTHDDGDEPVLAVYLILMVARGGRITVEGRRVGRISHHAVERMYQRLRTSSHEVVRAELRKAMYWVPLLYCSAVPSRRSSAVHQLPVPAGRGVLRCVRDPEIGELEVRTFTLHRPDDRVAASVRSLQRWHVLPSSERIDAFPALMREPGNRWWRERYVPG